MVTLKLASNATTLNPKTLLVKEQGLDYDLSAFPSPQVHGALQGPAKLLYKGRV